MVISEYSEFSLISFGDLHGEIQPLTCLKERGENQAGPLFTVLNCVDSCGCMDECTRPLLEWAIPDNIRTPPIEEIGFPDFFR